MSDARDAAVRTDEAPPEGKERAPRGTGPAALVRWALVGLMAFAAIDAWVYHAATSAVVADDGPRFHCPMHPSIVTSAKGECPVCGMDLVPALDDDDAIAGGVGPRLVASAVPGVATPEPSAERGQLMGLRTATARRGRLASRIRTGGFAARESGLADVTLDLPATGPVLVPRDALVDTGDAQYVFVSGGAGRFEPRRVRAGAEADGKIAILEGLEDGEVVVTAANFLLDSAGRIRAAIERRLEPTSVAPVPGDREDP